MAWQTNLRIEIRGYAMILMNNDKKENFEGEKTVELSAEDLANMVNEYVQIGSSSIIGMREMQEDAYFVEEKVEDRFVMGIVCDGMGGLSGGEIASNAAVDYLSNSIDGSANVDEIRFRMFEAAKEANDVVKSLINQEGNLLRAGTTMIMAVIKEGFLNWVSVGDSKIFLLRNSEMFCLTKEHNYEFMAEKNKDDDDFNFNPEVRKDALVSYLGAEELKYIDINQQPLELYDNDIVILCSDGLYKSLSEEQIMVMFLSEDHDMERAAAMLTEAALINATGNQDNTTVIVLQYKKEKIIED